MTIISDHPITNVNKAFFGYKQYAETLANVVSEAETPVTVGIFGSWGTGKTSLMQIMHENLENHEFKDRVLPVWFNAWRFEKEENLVVPLLLTIHEAVHSRIQQSPDIQVIKDFGNSLGRLIYSIAAGTEISLGLFDFSVKQKIGDSLEKAKDLQQAEEPPVESIFFDIYKHLSTSLEEIDPLRLVIFVDDLDRCSDENVLKMLETIKLIFDFPGVAFVLGVDQVVIERLIAKKFGDDSGIDGSLFLKKLIQVYFVLPKLKNDDVRSFIRELLLRAGSPLASLDILENIFATGAGENPREIKRLVNNYLLLRRLSIRSTTPELTAIFLVLQQNWVELYKAIVDQREEFVQFLPWLSDNHQKKFVVIKDENNLRNFPFSEESWDFIRSYKQLLATLDNSSIDEYLNFASIAAFAPLQPGDLAFQHTIDGQSVSTQDPSRSLYHWRIKPMATTNTLNKIQEIVYQLPPMYKPTTRTTTIDSGFSISGKGSQNFEIDILVKLKSGETKEFPKYFVDLRPVELEEIHS